MTVAIPRSLTLARVVARVAVGAGVAAVVAPLGYRIGLMPLLASFALVGLAVVLLVLAALTALVLVVYTRGESGVLRPAAVAGAVALAVLAVPVSAVQSARGVPPIHDISTDLVDPPTFDALVAIRGDGSNPLDRSAPGLDDAQRAAYPDLQSVVLEQSPAEAFLEAAAAVERLGWDVVAADDAAGRIEASETSGLFGFVDDVVIRVRAGERGSRVDVRSVSRVGQGDLGVNARRIRAFIEQLSSRVAVAG